MNRGMEVLQTSALPLGYAASALSMTLRGAVAVFLQAGDRARTGDPNLGKVVLYQLSYTRMILYIGRKSGLLLRRNYNKFPWLVK